MLLTATGLTKAYGSHPLFESITCAIDSEDRVGLIGPNGAGKSTLLAILAGTVQADEGSVSSRRGLTIGFVPQIPRFEKGATLRQTILAAAVPRTQEEEWEALLAADEVIAKLSLMAEGRTETTPLAELSGGWQKRVALARELVRKPDLLLLDEPTNHLDVDAIQWLESFLAKARFATLTVTHDRVFLQKVSTRILELDRRNPGGLLDVRGNYGTYLSVKEENLAASERRESALRNRLHRETEWLMRGPKARTTKQQARIQRAATLATELEDLSARNRTRTIEIDFDVAEKNPRRLIEATGIGKSYGGRSLFTGLDLVVTPRSRIGLIGPNGCGKSTLLRVLLGQEAPDSGQVTLSENLNPAVFEQGRDSLDPDKTVARTLCPEGEHVEYRGTFIHIRSYLDRFLFRDEQKDIAVGRLSGGEQSRLLLARLMLRKTNLLILDEPTNDLDLGTLSVLEDCLADFPGGILLVTHDRYFLDRVTNQLIGFGRDEKGQGVVTMLSGLDQWAEWREELAQSEAARRTPRVTPPQKEAPRKKRLGYLEQRELAEMEEKIKRAEASRDLLRNATEEPENVSNHQKLLELLRSIEEKEGEIDRLYARWSELEGLASGSDS